RTGEIDAGAFAWTVMAITSARISDVDPGRDEAPRLLDPARVQPLAKLLDEAEGKGFGGPFATASNSPTAIFLLARQFLPRALGEPPSKHYGPRYHYAKALVEDDALPRWEPSAPDSPIDYFCWNQATLALFQHDGPAGEIWKTWNKA